MRLIGKKEMKREDLLTFFEPQSSVHDFQLRLANFCAKLEDLNMRDGDVRRAVRNPNNFEYGFKVEQGNARLWTDYFPAGFWVLFLFKNL